MTTVLKLNHQLFLAEEGQSQAIGGAVVLVRLPLNLKTQNPDIKSLIRAPDQRKKRLKYFNNVSICNKET